MNPLLPHIRLPRVLLLLVLLFSLSAWAQIPEPPGVAADAYLVMDVTAGQVLASKDIDKPVEPASLTKLMTTYLVFDALRAKKITLEQTLPVSEEAWKTPGSRMFVEPNTQVPVEDLLKGLIVQSGNDAAIVLAEGLGGTVDHFVQLMNDQAQALGMKNTTYKNPDGLPDAGHLTTARDLATLSVHLIQDFPEYAHYHAIKNYRYPGTPEANATNRNRLLFVDPTVDGLKTGHTDAAGYCLVATARREFPNVGERRMLTVVLGASSESVRTTESQKLLNWGYTAFDDVKLFDADAAVATPRVWKGSAKTLELGSKTPVIVAVPTGSADKIKTEVVRPEPLIAPFAEGETVATLKVSLGDAQLSEVPLVALQAVPEAGLFSRAWDALRLWVTGWF